ncbi:hypothetical protein GNP82_10455 [Aliivibrio fischeri]|nr:hypothetical protein [Aliivibrio fischeri]MUJ20682.1 hypothetical protein [Aliivibrio fischeri]MUK37973.1 hypothetical protein [Aliivibrio fischeri]MUL06057.1 hypothetical protein [Aliivibrio fischeri]MUL17887.1 hypothetical protein [Aliivibrio fischeri]
MKKTKGQVLTKFAAFAAVFFLLAVIAAPKFLGNDSDAHASKSSLSLYTE